MNILVPPDDDNRTKFIGANCHALKQENTYTKILKIHLPSLTHNRRIGHIDEEARGKCKHQW